MTLKSLIKRTTQTEPGSNNHLYICWIIRCVANKPIWNHPNNSKQRRNRTNNWKRVYDVLSKRDRQFTKTDFTSDIVITEGHRRLGKQHESMRKGAHSFLPRVL